MEELDKEQLKKFLEDREIGKLRKKLPEFRTPELASLISEQEDKLERSLLFRLLPHEVSAEVFSYLDTDQQDLLLEDLSDQETRHLLTQLSPDDRTALFEELPGEVSRRLFGLLSPEAYKETRKLLGYPEQSVGRLMTPAYVEVRPEWTVDEVIRHIRKAGIDRETINIIFVTDDTGKLIDDLRLRRIILSEPDTKISELIDKTYISLSAFDDREKAVKIMKDYDYVALPVVDSDGRLLGIVTVDDIMDVEEQEVTEDVLKASAIEPLNMSYRQAGIWTLFHRRFFWLAALVVANLVSSGVIERYEEILAASVALAFFIPLLIDSGGNSGSQAATMMIRALVTGELQMRDWAVTLVKELGVGLLLGAALALLAAGLGTYRGGTDIGLIVGLSMVAIIVVANLIGMTLPFALSKLKIDPTVASAPLITTICDASGLLLYFTIATAVLGV